MAKYEKLLPGEMRFPGRDGQNKSQLRRDIEDMPVNVKLALSDRDTYARAGYHVTEIHKNPKFKDYVWKRFRKDGKFYIARIK